jgi:hypothetical protein
MKAMRARDLVALAGACLLSTLSGCERTAPPGDAAKPPPASTEAPEAPGPAAHGDTERMAPGARRVKLVVVPGDAAVEVDGVPRPRRDGLVELVGPVGTRAYHVRVSRGAQHGERDVTIQESGASPPRLDLSEIAQAAPAPLRAGSFAPPPPGAAGAPSAAELNEVNEVAAASHPSTTQATESVMVELMERAEKARACVCPPPPEIRCPNAPPAAGGVKAKDPLAGDDWR